MDLPDPSSAALAATARRRAGAALAGHRGDEESARTFQHDPDPAVRATALAALSRLGSLTPDDVQSALHDADPDLRRRACEMSIGLVEVDLRSSLDDLDVYVAEAAAWAAGERQDTALVGALAAMAGGHRDPLCREAAIAALGSIGDRAGLDAILAGLTDKPAVRRRAVLALAPFEGPEVRAGLESARQDRDWQVRQAAEDLLDP